jgi:NADPH:quinone reductase-like Zn-dependent oxidoreductase
MVTIEYPGVLGSPVAGVVEAIGASVSKVAKGDRVVCGTKIFSHKKAKYGGLQRFSVVDESEIVEVSSRYLTQHASADIHIRLATSSSQRPSHWVLTHHQEHFSGHQP